MRKLFSNCRANMREKAAQDHHFFAAEIAPSLVQPIPNKENITGSSVINTKSILWKRQIIHSAIVLKNTLHGCWQPTGCIKSNPVAAGTERGTRNLSVLVNHGECDPVEVAWLFHTSAQEGKKCEFMEIADCIYAEIVSGNQTQYSRLQDLR